jgi:hypothetical protein
MEYIEVEAVPHYRIPLCDCGGEISERVGDMQFMSDPPQQMYSCFECGKKYILNISQIPRVIYKRRESMYRRKIHDTRNYD